MLHLFWSGRNNFKLGRNDFELERNDSELGEQEYPTEPLDRKPARQAAITLAGKY